MIRKVFYSLVLALALFSCTISAHAQVTSDDIGVDVSPEQPGAFTSVTIKLSSYSINIGRADINWTLNKKLVLGGIGKTTYTFTTREIGSEDSLKITITPMGGFPIEKTVVIHPMGMDLLWQAIDSVVPPLYRGKALPSSESKIKVVAMPEIRSSSTRVSAQNDLVYTWKQNYDLAGDDISGYGKSAFTIDTSYLNTSERVDVNAETRDGRLGATASIDVATQDSKILWYAVSPLYGPLFERALSNGYEVAGSEQTFLAEPYYFSAINSASPSLQYTWSINGESVTTPTLPNTISLHRDTTTAGEALISLSIRNVSKIFQTAKEALTLSLK
jgi:hypothetical protein